MKSYEDFRIMNEGRYGRQGTVWLLFDPEGVCHGAFIDPARAARALEEMSSGHPGWMLVSVDVRAAARHVTAEGMRKLFEDGYVTVSEGWIYFTSAKHRTILRGRI